MMNKYQEALDVICRYVSDQRHDIVRYTEREICECLGTLGEMEKQFAKYQKALDKACAELVKLKECADCWEYEEDCPFRNECKEGTNYCYDTRCWKEWLLNDGIKQK